MRSGFVGHESPLTRGPDDRVRAAADATSSSPALHGIGMGVVQSPPREDEPRVNVVAVILDG